MFSARLLAAGTDSAVVTVFIREIPVHRNPQLLNKSKYDVYFPSRKANLSSLKLNTNTSPMHGKKHTKKYIYQNEIYLSPPFFFHFVL
jgi:hypothetical protein